MATNTLPPITAASGACCPPLTRSILEPDEAEGLAWIFKALGDPGRAANGDRILSV